MRRLLLAALALACGAALESCGGKATSFVDVQWPPAGSAAEFDTLVMRATATGAVTPTDAMANVALLMTVEVSGLRTAWAMFDNGPHFQDAGTVTVRTHNVAGPGTTQKALDILGLQVNGTPEYFYTSLVSNPLGLNLTFDGVEHHVFTVGGSGSVTAFTDSARSVVHPGVTAPAGGASVSRASDLTVSFSGASLDSTVRTLAVITSLVDSSKVARSDLSLDGASLVVPTSRLAALPAGAARLAVARWRLSYRDHSGRLVGLGSEGVDVKALTLN